MSKARTAFREASAPVLDQYFALCRETVRKVLPSSALAKAFAYSLNLEKELHRFLSALKGNIDNNPC